MLRFMLFCFLGMIGLGGVKDGNYNVVTYCIGLSVLAFLFWGIGLLFGGDGLVPRIINRNKLSTQEQDDMEFLRKYSSKYDWFLIYCRALRGADCNDPKAKSDRDYVMEERWKLQRRFKEIEKSVFEDKGSKTFNNMARARMWRIRAHADEQAALNFLE